jgi:bifunctional non-homologous end joining protein LigD
MALEEYRRKRDFGKTAEPEGKAARRAKARGLSYVIQKHAASRLHYDFRLEWDGVLKSWAVPKGPSLDPADKRLAVHVEDHPLEYGGFEGTIPQGEYGGGTVMLWDRGTWEPLGDATAGLAKGHIKFKLDGARLKGHWALVQMHGPRSGDGKNWLLVKEHDAAERPGHGAEAVERFDTSVASRRTMDGIAKAGDNVWRSKPRRTAFEARTERLVERAAAKAKPQRIEGAANAPMPRSFEPVLASLAAAPPEGDNWLHEIKLDGYRMIARIDGGKVAMLSRNGKDWSGRFPRIEAALLHLPLERAAIDGEVVHLDKNGVSSFTSLKDDLSANRTDGLVYYAFDLLYLDGQSLARAPLTARKAALETLLADASDPLRFSAHVAGEGARVFAEACRMKLEGIVSKRADAPYRAGRSADWVKVKCLAREEFLVLGWTDPGGKRKGLGALLLGYYDGTGALRFAGAVGTGFTARSLDELRARLDRLARKTPPSPAIAKEAPKGAHWVKPELVAEIQYTEWTGDGRLRHPSYMGLREDKDPSEVTPDRIKAAAAPPPASPKTGSSAGAVEVAGVRLTHPGKVLFGQAKATKLDLARYYVDVAERMLPHVRGRPLTLVRAPDGAGGKSFYQKHPGEGTPDALKRVEIAEKGGTTTYLIADDVRGLVSLVQMGVLEVHLWGSTRAALETPDRIIFDLDPDEGLPWERVVAGALAVRDLLTEMGLETWPKATGGKGLHVVLPVRPKYDWDAVKAFTHAVAQEIVRREPAAYTGALPKKDRRGKIFIDYLRNQRGATAIAPFSARAKPQAPVALPLTWKEVEQGVRGDAFTIATAPERLRKEKRDPWDGMAEAKQQLPAAAMRKAR